MLSMRVNFLASQVVLRYCPSSVLADVPLRNIYAMGNRDQRQLHHVDAWRHGQPGILLRMPTSVLLQLVLQLDELCREILQAA